MIPPVAFRFPHCVADTADTRSSFIAYSTCSSFTLGVWYRWGYRGKNMVSQQKNAQVCHCVSSEVTCTDRVTHYQHHLQRPSYGWAVGQTLSAAGQSSFKFSSKR